MNYLFWGLSSLLLLLSACTQKSDFALQNGDLLFSVGRENSSFVNAIKSSTSRGEEIPFSHVGIVEINCDSVFVIEATAPDGVVRTSLDQFLAKAYSSEGKTVVAVGRLKPRPNYSVDKTMLIARGLIGRPYDYAYDEDNDAFYCSELVRFSFTDFSGRRIFEPLAMSFKNKETGKTEPFWEEHFKRLKTPVPEGKPGTNPADLSKSKILDIVHRYY